MKCYRIWIFVYCIFTCNMFPQFVQYTMFYPLFVVIYLGVTLVLEIDKLPCSRSSIVHILTIVVGSDLTCDAMFKSQITVDGSLANISLNSQQVFLQSLVLIFNNIYSIWIFCSFMLVIISAYHDSLNHIYSLPLNLSCCPHVYMTNLSRQISFIMPHWWNYFSYNRGSTCVGYAACFFLFVYYYGHLLIYFLCIFDP